MQIHTYLAISKHKILQMNCQMTGLEHDRQTNHHRAVEGGGKVRGMKEILAAIDEGGERGLDLSDEVRSRLYT